MNPDPIVLYARLRERLQSGQMSPAQVEEFLASTGQPSFSALGRNYAANMSAPEPEPGNPLVEAAHSTASAVSNAATLGLLDNIIGMIDPELGERMQERARQVRQDSPVAATALDVGVGAAIPAGAVGSLARGGGLIAKGLTGAATGAIEGGAYGLGAADVGEEGAMDLAGGSLIGATAGGIGGLVAPLLSALGRRAGQQGNNAATRLSARLAEMSGDVAAPTGVRRAQQNMPFAGGRVAEGSLENVPAASAVRMDLDLNKQAVGREVFGSLQDIPLSRETMDLMDELRHNPVTAPFAETLKGRGADQVLPEGARIEWQFNDAREMYQRLNQLTRMKAIGLADQSDAQSLRNITNRLKEALDIDTQGQFSVANRAYAQAAEEAEAFDIGLGYRRIGETALDAQSGFSSPSQLEAAVEQFSDNPRAQERFREGLRHNVYEFGPQTPTTPIIDKALGQQLSDREMLRFMFPAGAEGDAAYARWLREGLIERSANILGQDVDRGLGAAGRGIAIRSVPFGR